MRENILKKYIVTILLVFETACAYNESRPAPLNSYQRPFDEEVIEEQNFIKPVESKIQYAAPVNEKIIESKPVVKQEVYIPSALKNTDIDEIEVIEEIRQPQTVIKSKITPEIKTEDVIIENEVTTEPLKKVTVKGKDTLYSIAKTYNVKVYDLANFNKIEPPFTLKIGTVLTIPTIEALNPKKQEPEIVSNIKTDKTFIEEPTKDFIIVKKKDTIYSIAKANKIPLKDLILRNNLTPPINIKIGDKIFLPNTAVHIVKAKDTVYSISKKYSVSLSSLVKLNKIDAPFILSIGQKIILPAGIKQENEKYNNYIIKDKQQTKTFANNKYGTKTKAVSSVKLLKKEKVVEKSDEKIIAKQKVAIEKVIVKPQPLASSSFMWPTKGQVIAEYSVKGKGLRNNGINISAKMGTAVVASNNGIIAYAGNELKGLGNLIIIKHDKKYMTVYAHNDEILVKKDDKVVMGQKIAFVGKTGRVSTPQLHFEIRQGTKSIDPRKMLK